MNLTKLKQWAAEHNLSMEAQESLFALFETNAGHTLLHPVPEDTLLSPLESASTTNIFDGERYEFICLLGTGGMGEVYRVYDRKLKRTLAMKVIHKGNHCRKDHISRFVEEAQISSQLQHSNIPPIYDLNHLPDGRLYFTMQEIRGQSLQMILSARQQAAEQHMNHPWPLRRLIEIVLKTCSAMAYAHSHGVIHRDLKPANIMVDQHDEVLVVDWGIAKPLEQLYQFSSVANQRVETSRGNNTQYGMITGTPAYMSPEQASGDPYLMGAHSDIYTVGAILYCILTGHPPHQASDNQARIRLAREGTPPPILEKIQAQNRNIVMPLVDICERAMKSNPHYRYATMDDMHADILKWLNGTQAREKALKLVTKAADLHVQANQLYEQASSMRQQLQKQKDELRGWQPMESRLARWQQEDQAAAINYKAERMLAEVEQTLSSALSHQFHLVEAHAALAKLYQKKHQHAELRREKVAAESLASRILQHTEWLPDSEQKTLRAYLTGQGSFTLETNPPGADVYISTVTTEQRRLVPQKMTFLQQTPIHNREIAMGNYILHIRKAGYEDVIYPMSIRRQQHWHGNPPNESRPLAIWLPPKGTLQANECYIPAGWFYYGGDPQTHNSVAERHVFLPGFIIHQNQITQQQFIDYLHDLIETGQEEVALTLAPRERASNPNHLGALLYHYENQRFSLQIDSDGDAWHADWPIMMISWDTVLQYIQWRRDQDGLSWQLPSQLQWEKAARGVDGRYFPWGYHCDPSWARLRDSTPNRSSPAGIQDYPLDCSPYGVLGMAGNCQDFTSNLIEDDSRVVVCGGSWWHSARAARLCNRYHYNITDKVGNLSFRLVRPIPQ